MCTGRAIAGDPRALVAARKWLALMSSPTARWPSGWRKGAHGTQGFSQHHADSTAAARKADACARPPARGPQEVVAHFPSIRSPGGWTGIGAARGQLFNRDGFLPDGHGVWGSSEGMKGARCPQ